jgi:molybdopterin-guanine dinucleotide biosynthesis protein A/ribosomal protein S18 acetylase RimI-like enzyme
VAPAGLTGILLVGGASTRFGSPKALAHFEGETLASRAWRTLGEVADDRIAVGKPGELKLTFALHDDGIEIRAPIAGIVAGLREARAETAIVMPVDMPFISAGDLRTLVDACEDAAIPQTGPLPCALRRDAALPALELRLERGELALGDAFAELRTRTVELEPTHLVNINTRADLGASALTIVALGPEHASGFRSLVTDTHREYGFDFDSELDADLEDPATHYAAAWVVLQGETVVGSVALRHVDETEIELKRMYLRPALRGRGVGQRLLELALRWAHEHRIERIVLDTTEEMVAARRLYERNGFVRFPDTARRQGRELLLYELKL